MSDDDEQISRLTVLALRHVVQINFLDATYRQLFFPKYNIGSMLKICTVDLSLSSFTLSVPGHASTVTHKGINNNNNNVL